jgi:hypothetical protein
MAAESDELVRAMRVLTMLRMARLKKALATVDARKFDDFQTNRGRVDTLVGLVPQLTNVRDALLSDLGSEAVSTQDLKKRATELYQRAIEAHEVDLVAKAQRLTKQDLSEQEQSVLDLVSRVDPEELDKVIKNGGNVEKFLIKEAFQPFEQRVERGEPAEREERKERRKPGVDEFGLERQQHASLEDLSDWAVDTLALDLEAKKRKNFTRLLNEGRPESIRKAVDLVTHDLPYVEGASLARKLYFEFVKRKLWELEDTLRFGDSRLQLLHDLRVDWEARMEG